MKNVESCGGDLYTTHKEQIVRAKEKRTRTNTN